MSASESQLSRVKDRLAGLGLKEYQAAILACVVLLGEGTAARLGRAAKVPSARVYETISELESKGLIKVRPGRPMICTALSPKETVERLLWLRRTTLEAEMNRVKNMAGSLIRELNRLAPRVRVPLKRSPLVRVVDVGEASEEETRVLYRRAKEQILILSRALEYLPRVIQDLADAVKRGVSLKLILLEPSKLVAEDVRIQNEMIALLRSRVSSPQLKLSRDIPLRGSIIDPKGKGAAIFLAEEIGVPLFVREAAVTENTGFVRGLSKLFDLMWQATPDRDTSIEGRPKTAAETMYVGCLD